MAVSIEIKNKYKTTIGIECHVQLKTKTKLFSAVSNDARDAKPNTLISHIDTGMPGALPVLNHEALVMAAKAAFALNTEPQKHSYFERKHYFYPDSPLGYQISQLHAPIILGGTVVISTGDQKKTIRINRAQLEADAGKNTHPEGANYSLVDLNRAGTPLLEIVSEPDINSAAEAKAYARELYLLMKYADISDVDLYYGNMRFDVNVSVSKTDVLGVRSEVKNLNSFRSVENAVSFELDRQIELLHNGQAVVQETRGWDEAKQKTTSMRGKEEAQDYRYMPEPDVPPVELSAEFITKAKSDLPELPHQIREQLSELNIDNKVSEDILDNFKVYEKIKLAIKYDTPVEIIRRIAFDCLESPEILSVSIEDHIKVASELIIGKIGSSAAKDILLAKANNMGLSLDELLLAKQQMSDESELDKIVAEIISLNQQAADDVRNGEAKAIGFLVGQVMAKSQGKANPQVAQQIIKKQLGQ